VPKVERCGNQWKQHAASVNLHDLLLDVLAIVVGCGKDDKSELLIGKINGAADAEASHLQNDDATVGQTSRLWTDLSSR